MRLFTKSAISATFLLLLLVPAPEASAYDFLQPGSRGSSLAGAMAANSSDAFAVWYNPALLGQVDDHRFGLDYAILYPVLKVEVDQVGSLGFVPALQGYDSGEHLSQSLTLSRINEAFGTEAPPEMLHGFNVHLLVPLHRLMPNLPIRVGLAGTLFVPCGGTCVVKVRGHTPDQPFFPVFGSRNQRLRLMLGLGIELIRDWWAIGVSASFFCDMEGRVSSYTPVSTFDSEHPEENPPGASTATFTQELGTNVTPVFGTVVTPTKDLSIGLYYRMAERLHVSFAVDAGVFFDMGYSIEAQMPYFLEGDFFFVPAALGLGIAGTLFGSLRLTAQVDYVFWSDVTENINVNDFDLADGATNEAGGLTTMEEYGDFRVRSLLPPKIRARNIICPRVGAEYTLNKYVQFRAGYSYAPSALEEDQEYGNMLLDNNYHTVGLGIGLSYFDALKLLELPILIDIHGQMAFLETRYNKVGVKDDIGGYQARGVVKTSGFFWSAGLTVTFQL